MKNLCLPLTFALALSSAACGSIGSRLSEDCRESPCPEGKLCALDTGQCLEARPGGCRENGCPDDQICHPIEAACVDANFCAGEVCGDDEVCDRSTLRCVPRDVMRPPPTPNPTPPATPGDPDPDPGEFCALVTCNRGEICDPETQSCVRVAPPVDCAGGEIGCPCERNADCAGSGPGARCISEERFEAFEGGYCTADCRAAAGCPAGAACVDTQSGPICLRACNDTAECREGYLCSPSNVERICLPGGGSDCTENCSGPGGPCAGDDDCYAGASCISEVGDGRELPGGFCLGFGCGGAQACPPESRCVQVTEDGLTACFPSCVPGAGDCREGYVCNSVDGVVDEGLCFLPP